MEYRDNAGSAHAITKYIRVGAQLGHRIAFYGPSQPLTVDGWYLPPEQQNARFSTDLEAFDRIVYLFESKLRLTKRLPEVAMLGTFPRACRYILDADGRFNPYTVVDGYDRSHKDEAERAAWIEYYEALSDKIIKPTLARDSDPRVISQAFFGFGPEEVIKPADAPPKRYDILYVGHNWYRWKEMSEEVLPALEKIRNRVGEIGIVGLWWDGVPHWAHKMGLEPAYRMETEKFHQLKIRVEPPVKYTEVVRTMSTGRINIMLQRPYLAHVKHLTLRYFEEFCADTIPLLMLKDDLAEAVYGPAGRELTLPGRVAEKILDVLERPAHYFMVVDEVRRHLRVHHSFPKRVEELVTVLSR
jgi:hypothetical protein